MAVEPLCNELNNFFIKGILPKKLDHQTAKAWEFIRKTLLDMAKEESAKESEDSVALDLCLIMDNSDVFMAKAYAPEKKVNITEEGVLGCIPIAKSNGLRVEFVPKEECDSDDTSILYLSFTPSNSPTSLNL